MEKKRPASQSEGGWKSLWRSYVFTEGGKPKSATFLISFCLSFLVLAVYAAAYYALLGPLERLTEGWASLPANLLQANVPALAATAVVTLAWPVFENKLILPLTYVWLTAYALLLLLLGLFLAGEGRALFLTYLLMTAAAPLAFGNLAVWLLFARYKRSFIR